MGSFSIWHWLIVIIFLLALGAIFIWIWKKTRIGAIISIIAFLAIMAYYGSRESAEDNAYLFCREMMEIDLVTSCDTNSKNNRINLVMDINAYQAEEVCNRTEQLRGKFKGKWELRIMSPYSGGTPIAACTLY